MAPPSTTTTTTTTTTAAAAAAAATNNDAEPYILLLSLSISPLFSINYGSFITKLAGKGKVKRVKTHESAARILAPEQPAPSVILVTDPAILIPDNDEVLDPVIRYIREGGTCVLMGEVYCMVSMFGNNFFERAGLPWECAGNVLGKFVLNPSAVDPVGDDGLAGKLPQRYGRDAVFVKNVKPEEAWYLNEDEWVYQTSGKALGRAPVAMARVGREKLGYVGDAKAEGGSEDVVFAMCGLL
ncbi:hypothetical protein B0T17DRAFT_260533 [Bombardia bombarda]|uniref:Uncharacterized protein n=1 Tax=Bombardia bombarda TaxID=252184 RepID=A0AA40C541_9PEZI|nr:hypothetical protein B0T17DRAFT_260533 [Bombardia bombarda]